MSETIKIDNIDYNVDDLSDEAKAQLVNLRLTDAKLEQLKQDAAIMQTARNAYANALKAALPTHADETIKFN